MLSYFLLKRFIVLQDIHISIEIQLLGSQCVKSEWLVRFTRLIMNTTYTSVVYIHTDTCTS